MCASAISARRPYHPLGGLRGALVTPPPGTPWARISLASSIIRRLSPRSTGTRVFNSAVRPVKLQLLYLVNSYLLRVNQRARSCLLSYHIYAVVLVSAARGRGGFDKAQVFINGLMFEACLPMGASKKAWLAERTLIRRGPMVGSLSRGVKTRKQLCSRVNVANKYEAEAIKKM